MSTIQIRTELHQYIDRLDERFLQAMFAMVQQYVENEEIIGHTGDGKKLTQQQLTKAVQHSYQEYKEGKVHNHADVALQIEQW